MYEIKVESAFKADYARVMKRHPRLRGEFKEAVSELMRTGAVPDEYGPHELSNPGENYNGHVALFRAAIFRSAKFGKEAKY